MKLLYRHGLVGLRAVLPGLLSTSAARADEVLAANGGTIGAYTTSEGTLNASLISRLSVPNDIAIVPTAGAVREPGSLTFLGLALAGLGFHAWRKRASYTKMAVRKLYLSLSLMACLNVSAVVGHATAITLNCTPNPINETGTNTATVSCPAFNVAGATSLDSVTVTDTASYTGPSTLVTFFGTVSGVNNRLVEGDLTAGIFLSVSGGGPASGSLTASSHHGVTIALFNSGFSYSVGPSFVVGSPPTGTSHALTVTYDYSGGTASAPEPAAMPLLGMGLAAVALVHARRSRAQRLKEQSAPGTILQNRDSAGRLSFFRSRQNAPSSARPTG